MMETTTKKLLISTHCGIFFFTSMISLAIQKATERAAAAEKGFEIS
jgi:hypothetical protein